MYIMLHTIMKGDAGYWPACWHQPSLQTSQAKPANASKLVLPTKQLGLPACRCKAANRRRVEAVRRHHSTQSGQMFGSVMLGNAQLVRRYTPAASANGYPSRHFAWAHPNVLY
jgi:hypothetical protein